MRILAFETSCDDTSVAIFEDDKLLVMETKSQIRIHNETGGVVPEVAAREHANVIFEVIENVLKQQKAESRKLKENENNSKNLNVKATRFQYSAFNSIDYIGVTITPGLLPSLLTGTTVASTISLMLNIPIIPINHIEAHIFSNFLDRKEEEIKFPLVCLTASGGHNDVYLMKDMWTLEKLGSSIDDAAGEAFDKASKMMGLGYPGGPIISKLAEEYRTSFQLSPKQTSPLTPVNSHPNPLSHERGKASSNSPLFPRVWLVKKEFNFSFSGLKTSIKNEIDRRIKLKAESGKLKGNQIVRGGVNEDIKLKAKSGKLKEEKLGLSIEDKMELSFEIENAITEVLAWKLVNSAKENGVKTVMLAGGVSANTKLKNEIQKLADKEGMKFIYPKKNLYSMDNAGMVGINTYYKVKYGKFEKKVGIVKI